MLVCTVFPVSLELNPWRIIWNPSHSKQWSHLSIGREGIWTRYSLSSLSSIVSDYSHSKRGQPCSYPWAYIVIPLQPQHPRCLCRRGTPSPLTSPKTMTLLIRVLAKLGAWHYPRMRTYEKRMRKLILKALRPFIQKFAHSKISWYTLGDKMAVYPVPVLSCLVGYWNAKRYWG